MEAYVAGARKVVRSSRRLLAQNYSGEIQYLFFGRHGYVVVDDQHRIRGYFEHMKPGAVDKAFSGLREHNLWIRLSEATGTN